MQTKRSPRRNSFHHKSYSFLSRTVRLTNSNPKSLLLGCRGTLAQNRGTMGVQIPFSFPKGLDFKPFQAKVRVLPWQINNTFILPILSPHIFSKPCKYWLSSLYTLFSKTAFFLINSCIFSCFFGHFGYKWVIFLIRKALRNKAFMSYLCIFWGYKPVFIQFFLRFFQPGSLF